jgi:hypothetical protein
MDHPQISVAPSRRGFRNVLNITTRSSHVAIVFLCEEKLLVAKNGGHSIAWEARTATVVDR